MRRSNVVMLGKGSGCGPGDRPLAEVTDVEIMPSGDLIPNLRWTHQSECFAADQYKALVLATADFRELSQSEGDLSRRP